jgi:hypothetical protein
MIIDERFDSKVDRSGGPGACWPWAASTRRDGYGQFWAGDRMVLAHRFSLQRKLGRALLREELALHSCDQPPCVNPAHLRVGSHADNMLDMTAKERAQAKLTGADVGEIRALYAAGGVTQRALASRFGLTQSGVSYIISRKAWAHI